MAKGVTTSVTQGIASKLATKPTTDIWPKNKIDKGVRAQVTIHCSLNKFRSQVQPPNWCALRNYARIRA
jgi:hypothetical protein